MSISDEKLKEYAARKYGEYPILAQEILDLRYIASNRAERIQELLSDLTRKNLLLEEAYDIIKNHLPAYDDWIERAEKVCI